MHRWVLVPLSALLAACGPVEVRVVVTGGAYEEGCTSVTRVVEQATLVVDTCMEPWTEVPQAGTLRALGGRYCLRAREVTSCGRCRTATDQWEIQSGADIPIDLAGVPWADCDAEQHGFGRTCADRGLAPLVAFPAPRSLQSGLTQTCVLRRSGSDIAPVCWSSDPPTAQPMAGRRVTSFAVHGDAPCAVAACRPETCGLEACPFPVCSDGSGGAQFADRGWLCTACAGRVTCADEGSYEFSADPAADITSFAKGEMTECALVDEETICFLRGRQVPVAPLSEGTALELFVFGNRFCASTVTADERYQLACWANTGALLESQTSGDDEYFPLVDACATDDAICFVRAGTVSCIGRGGDPAVPVDGLARGIFESLTCTNDVVCAMPQDASEIWCWSPGGEPGDAPPTVAGARGSSPAQVCLAAGS